MNQPETVAKNLDLEVLRQFEPILKYTLGERFYPMDIDRYLAQSSLWIQTPQSPPEKLIAQGELDRNRLAEIRTGDANAVQYIKFIDPLDILQLARLSINEAVKSVLHPGEEQKFRAGKGRLARVGYVSRFIDALFSLALLWRGRVPGDTALAAAIAYRQMQAEEERYTYYGRILRENGWIVLQYWYFYPFNNWRSGFFGVNDHEADWELITIYCYEDNHADGTIPLHLQLCPEWVAYAAHDDKGPDLRRHWHDPELEKELGDDGRLHPVVYVGAGSHACYYQAGEYLAEMELHFLKPVSRILRGLQSFWRDVLRQGRRAGPSDRWVVFRVPFVDYARGDGVKIGPCQALEWTPEILDEHTPWAINYRGLWGWYAQDPISGEDAPAGPVYRRNGEIRQRWSDPVGWVELEKTPSPSQRSRRLAEQLHKLEIEKEQLIARINEKSLDVQRLGLEVDVLQAMPQLATTHADISVELEAEVEQLRELRLQLDRIANRLDALELMNQQTVGYGEGFRRSHLRRPNQPSPNIALRLARLAEAFAALSIGLVMVGLVLMILFAREYLLVGLVAMVTVLILAEAGFRRRLNQLVISLTIGLAIVNALILIWEFFWQIVIVLLFGAGLYIMWENVRELWT